MNANTNEYGVKLDRNGYAPSILQDTEKCRLCGTRTGRLERHEIYNAANRKKSKAYGLWVWLCHGCHMRITHENGKERMLLKEKSQERALEYYRWTAEDFRARFGKNYLD